MRRNFMGYVPYYVLNNNRIQAQTERLIAMVLQVAPLFFGLAVLYLIFSTL